LILWPRILVTPFSQISWFAGKALHRPWVWSLYWHHTRSSNMTCRLLFVRMQINNSWILPWIRYYLPCIFQNLLSKERIYVFLIDISVINGYKKPVLLLLEAIVWPEAVIKGEEMRLFIFASGLVYNGGIVFHLYAGNTSEKLLSLVKRTNSDGNFDAHNLIVRIFYYTYIDRSIQNIRNLLCYISFCEATKLILKNIFYFIFMKIVTNWFPIFDFFYLKNNGYIDWFRLCNVLLIGNTICNNF
jgi:hypothetical protein